MKYVFLFLLVFSSVLFVGCSAQEQTEVVDASSIDFRVDSLYEHSLFMVEFSKEETISAIGLNISFLVEDYDRLSNEVKIEQMGRAFGVDLTGSKEDKLILLEEKMNTMMEEWYELEAKVKRKVELEISQEII